MTSPELPFHDASSMCMISAHPTDDDPPAPPIPAPPIPAPPVAAPPIPAPPVPAPPAPRIPPVPDTPPLPMDESGGDAPPAPPSSRLAGLSFVQLAATKRQSVLVK